ncbi:MAG: hypothetical protein K6G88_08885 [Lachnospiraceae bacterium]|nr:hypothetical protein [Lachnospiraceae bacterium]
MLNNDSIKLLRECDAGIIMGVKSISRYINQYSNAETEVVSIAKNLRDIEEELEIELREYL